jgi:hypothetical protein
MNIALCKEFERRITEKVSHGLYTSASEVMFMTALKFVQLRNILSFIKLVKVLVL